MQAFTDVENALTAWRFTTEQEGLQRQAVATARNAANIARAQMQAGTVDITTVLQAETTLFSDEDLLVQVRLARFQALLSLYKALGGGWVEPSGPIQDQFPGLKPAWCPAGWPCRWEATFDDASQGVAMDILTRETRPIWRRVAPVAPLADGVAVPAGLAGIGYAIWFWPAGSGGQTARDRDANLPIPVAGRDGRTAGRADLSGRARHRAGVQYRDDQADGRRAAVWR